MDLVLTLARYVSNTKLSLLLVEKGNNPSQYTHFFEEGKQACEWLQPAKGEEKRNPKAFYLDQYLPVLVKNLSQIDPAVGKDLTDLSQAQLGLEKLLASSGESPESDIKTSRELIPCFRRLGHALSYYLSASENCSPPPKQYAFQQSHS